MLITFSTIFFQSAEAGTNPLKFDWYEGTVEFQNNKVISGEIHLNQSLGLVLIKENNAIKTIPAFQFKSVNYFDSELNVPRYFISLFERRGFSSNDVKIYEIVVQGDFMILRQEHEFVFNGNNLTGKMSKKDFKNIGNFKYFLYDGVDVTKLNQIGKKKLYAMTDRFADEIKAFIKENSIHLNDTFARIQLFAYYNALSQCKIEGGNC